MKLNQFAVYQLKQDAQGRKLAFRSYQSIKEQGIAVRVEYYDQVYLTTALPHDTIEAIWKRLSLKMPKNFKGYHSPSTSDVIVYNHEGTVSAYYIDKERLVPIAGFIRLHSSSTMVSMETTDFHVEGKKGNWIAADEIIIDGRQFFLMESDTYKNSAQYLVVSQEGEIVSQESRGFDEQTIQQIRKFLNSSHSENFIEKPKLETYQKYYENGEYLRSAELTEEQNYNMIDGRINNISGKKKQERESVLRKLHQKQKEIAARSGKQQLQDLERNRFKVAGRGVFIL